MGNYRQVRHNPVWYVWEFESPTGYKGNNAPQLKPNYNMTDCKELLVALAQDDPQIGIFNLYSEEDCGNSIEKQVRLFFGVAGINNLTPGQYLYSYELEYHGEGWSFDAKLCDSMDDIIYLYKIGNDTK